VRLEDRACPGLDELAGIPQRAAFDPGLDRGVPQLGARAELLRRPFHRLLAGNDHAGSTATSSNRAPPMTFQSWSRRMGPRIGYLYNRYYRLFCLSCILRMILAPTGGP
jgi:hypothetical protein